jgi:hypothetical protein
MANKISKKPVKTNRKESNVAFADLSYQNTRDGYFKALGNAYNSPQAFKKRLDDCFISKMI